MTRILTAACVALGLLCLFQWYVLRDLKADLAAVDARARQAALLDLHDRRDEVLRVLAWMDVASGTRDTGDPAGGMCKNGAPNADRIGQWLFDTYLLERARGGTEIDARQRLLEVMRSTNR